MTKIPYWICRKGLRLPISG